MQIIKLVFKNLKRHLLRLFLTIIGVAIAVLAFTLLKTVVTAWYAGVDAAANNRVVSTHAVSFIFPLPLTYREQIARVEGVDKVCYFNWFQGVYKDKNQFFPRMATDPETFFDVYPECITTPEVKEKFIRTRNGCVIGAKLAKEYNLKVGDKMPVTGDIYPGDWEFEIVGIYKGRDKKSDETWMVFNWNYLNEQIRATQPSRAEHVGWYTFTVNKIDKIPQVSKQIDELFKNSEARTKTETEAAFNQGFISMSGAILAALEFVSYVIVGILLLVLGNTMVMSARERIREYAVLKTIGFTSSHLTILIMGESIIISIVGGAIGIALTYPLVAGIGEALARIFPIFNIAPSTLIFAIFFSLFAGVVASAFPVYRATKMSIVDGLRHIG
ncbi:MAG: ABC transporter permease [Ignavibacteriales bacterium]|nr:ABC transporter permease [Ignavibacteriales bacterium]